MEVFWSPVVMKTHPKFLNHLFNSDKPRMLFPISAHLAFSILSDEYFLSSLPFSFGILINVSLKQDWA